MPILIPGIGEQGGDLEASVKYGTDSKGRMAIINSSRQILYASQGSDFAKVAGQRAKKLKETINSILFSEGKGWP
jgi:orotidine-5'-phosphate decarboxylase